MQVHRCMNVAATRSTTVPKIVSCVVKKYINATATVVPAIPTDIRPRNTARSMNGQCNMISIYVPSQIRTRRICYLYHLYSSSRLLASMCLGSILSVDGTLGLHCDRNEGLSSLGVRN